MSETCLRNALSYNVGDVHLLCAIIFDLLDVVVFERFTFSEVTIALSII